MESRRQSLKTLSFGESELQLHAEHQNLWNKSRKKFFNCIDNIISKYEEKAKNESCREIDFSTGDVYENGSVVQCSYIPVFGKASWNPMDATDEEKLLEIQDMCEEELEDDDDVSGIVYLGSEDERDATTTRSCLYQNLSDSEELDSEDFSDTDDPSELINRNEGHLQNQQRNVNKNGPIEHPLEIELSSDENEISSVDPPKPLDKDSTLACATSEMPSSIHPSFDENVASSSFRSRLQQSHKILELADDKLTNGKKRVMNWMENNDFSVAKRPRVSAAKSCKFFLQGSIGNKDKTNLTSALCKPASTRCPIVFRDDFSFSQFSKFQNLDSTIKNIRNVNNLPNLDPVTFANLFQSRELVPVTRRHEQIYRPITSDETLQAAKRQCLKRQKWLKAVASLRKS